MNGIIVDGHNRWKILQEHPEIKYKVREMDFSDKWAAFEWMYKKQLGRRNLTDEQRTYMIGKMYEARKKSHGGDRRSEGFSKGQIDPLKKSMPAIQAIAQETGVAEPTVKRFGQFSKGIDALREQSPEAADKILHGKAKISKAAVRAVRQMEPEKVKKVADAIIEGKPIEKPEPQTVQPREHYSGGRTADYRKDREEIAVIAADMYNPSEDMAEEIKINKGAA